MTPRIGSLCSGMGGLEMAVQQVYGGDLAWVSDIDKGACKILAHRFPDVPNLGDMTTVDWADVEPVDIVCGGTPCQDISHAGARKGMTEGTRSNLWVTMREAIAQLRPGLVVWENVRGAYSARAASEVEREEGLLGVPDGGPPLRALGRVLGDLSSLGYVGGWHGLRAADVGAPHGRFRVFVVATDTEGGGEDAAQLAGLGGCAIESGHLAADAERGGRDGWTQDTVGGPVRGAAPAGAGPLLPTPRTSDTNGTGHHGDGGLDLRTAVQLMPTPRATDGTKGGPNQRGSSGDLMLPSAVRRQDWGIYAPAIERWESILGRVAPPPTMLSKKGTAQLSPRFSEFLMGLPAGHVTDVPGLSRNDMLKALGGGVVPAQCVAALRFLLDVEAAA